VLALFVPPFPVTILNHSPRLICFQYLQNNVQKKWANRCVLDFRFFEPTWYITDVITTGAEGSFLEHMQTVVHVFFKTTFAAPIKSAALKAIIDFFHIG
jgi:hypothetical protein